MVKLLLLSILLIFSGASSYRDKYKELDKKRGINKDLVYLHPAFRNQVIKLLKECERQGVRVDIVETYRTPARQNRVNKRGKSQLRGGRSKHQYGLAVDLVPVKDGVWDWDSRRKFNKMGRIGERLGLVWGGRWKHLYDPGHFEWNISAEDLRNGILPVEPDTVIIPIFN